MDDAELKRRLTVVVVIATVALVALAYVHIALPITEVKYIIPAGQPGN